MDEVREYVERIECITHTVYDTLQSGYEELIYKEALMVELREASISFERERIVPILYGSFVIGTGKADIVVIPAVGLSIPIECKKTGLKEDDRQQLRTYMKGMGDRCTDGILIRFPQPGNYEPDQPDRVEFLWARQDEAGNAKFFRHESGAWVLDDNKRKEPKSGKSGTRARTRAGAALPAGLD